MTQPPQTSQPVLSWAASRVLMMAADLCRFWYQRDENAVPAAFVLRVDTVLCDCGPGSRCLQPISDKYPDATNPDKPEQQARDSQAWWQGDFPQLQTFLRKLVSDPCCTLPEYAKQKYFISGKEDVFGVILTRTLVGPCCCSSSALTCLVTWSCVLELTLCDSHPQ